jgi:hypothetical protein
MFARWAAANLVVAAALLVLCRPNRIDHGHSGAESRTSVPRVTTDQRSPDAPLKAAATLQFHRTIPFRASAAAVHSAPERFGNPKGVRRPAMQWT